MSHEMTLMDKMYSVRIAPWHINMGTNVLMLDTAPESRPERMACAGHDFIVEQFPIYKKYEKEIEYNGIKLASDEFAPIEGWNMLTRDDTHDVLHVAKDSYQIVQNDVGHEIFEALSEGASLDDGTGGTVKNGALCYLSARVDTAYGVKGDDSPIYPYIVVTWTHDGTGAFQSRATTVRPVCWNTISAGEMEAKKSGRSFTFRHTKNIMDRIEDAKRVIAGAKEDTLRFIELGNELAAIAITNSVREQFVEWFIPMPESQFIISDRVLDNILDARNNLRKIFYSDTMPSVHRYTAYGLMQAGIEYLDHVRTYRNHDTYLGRTLLRDEPMKRKLVPMIRELVKA
jgi:phage/plasmid-like protein (TIGR03299 family)